VYLVVHHEWVLDLLGDVVQYRAAYKVDAQGQQSEWAVLPFECLDWRDSVSVHRKHVVKCDCSMFEGAVCVIWDEWD
jgi:hypothetical protein